MKCRLFSQARLANEELVQNAKGNESVPCVEKINCTEWLPFFNVIMHVTSSLVQSTFWRRELILVHLNVQSNSLCAKVLK